MKLRTKGADRALAAGITLLLMLFGGMAWGAYGAAAILPFVGLCAGLLLFTHLESIRRSEAAVSRLKNEAVNDFRQVESLFYVTSLLRPDPPLPDTRDGAASPDFLKKILELMAERRPALVVEAGSGVSTLVIAYNLKRLGGGRVVALEHDPAFAKTARDWIRLHRLEDYASVIDAPLGAASTNGQPWYDTSALNLEAPIEMLIIDGPPATIGQMARYPALPVLHDRLAANCVLLMDDGNREDERLTAERWTTEFPEFSAEFLYLEKGAYLLRR
ncbi:MAG TPA: class I SAM-dependent methyltransferase [Gemmatimonadaceae bacterium]|nr:class I SAM-dependent methyltransferase [Gemmatimonadaceae bacterium]